MLALAGIEQAGRRDLVDAMMARLRHRGRGAPNRTDAPRLTLATLGETPPPGDPHFHIDRLARSVLPFAVAIPTPEGVLLARDRLGVRPLYTGRTADGRLAFASEVKALPPAAHSIAEFPPGTWYQTGQGFHPFPTEEPLDHAGESPEQAAATLRERLEAAVLARLGAGQGAGAWLSGGLDSTVIVALARPHVAQLHTFAGGVDGAPDLLAAREAAAYLGTTHHEVVVDVAELVRLLPEVIFALETFDALLIRSSLLNYRVSRAASEHGLQQVLSGEGGDELFAGYAMLQNLPEDELALVLTRLVGSLHNTALQRVDRSAFAHGLVPHVPFLDPRVVTFALKLPLAWKVHVDGRGRTAKWLLRKAMEGRLPDSLLWRPKAKFWEGGGVQERLAEHAEQQVRDADFRAERTLPNGWSLNTKEELLYYRIFREHFGGLETLDWMGRTQGAPIQS